MNTQNDNKFVAQGAAAWQEKENHDQVMSDLNSVYGEEGSYFLINGNCYTWRVTRLPEKRLLEIFQRGRHDEIMYMIRRC